MARKRLVALETRSRGKAALYKLAKALSAAGFTPAVAPATARVLDAARCRKAGILVAKPGARPKPELAVALGGDGCFIQLAARYAPYALPLIGVNLGRVGFLADIPHDNMVEDILEVLAGKYADEKRIMLDCKLHRGGRVLEKFTVINDLVIDRGNIGTLINLDIAIDDNHGYDLRSDGLVISTPGGSTAYNMSAGGPIITPDCASITMTPLNPYSLTQRPLVFNIGRVFKIGITDRGRLVPDGDVLMSLRKGDVVSVRNHSRSMTVRHPLGYDYFDILRNKLSWRDS